MNAHGDNLRNRTHAGGHHDLDFLLDADAQEAVIVEALADTSYGMSSCTSTRRQASSQEWHIHE